jgi:hypothetical protein
LSAQRRVFSFERRLPRQFVDVRPCHERLFARAREDQHTDRIVAPRAFQAIAQLVERLEVQRV